MAAKCYNDPLNLNEFFDDFIDHLKRNNVTFIINLIILEIIHHSPPRNHDVETDSGYSGSSSPPRNPQVCS